MDPKLPPNAAASNSTAASSASNGAAGAGHVGAAGFVNQAEQRRFGAQGNYMDAMSGPFFAAAPVRPSGVFASHQFGYAPVAPYHGNTMNGPFFAAGNLTRAAFINPVPYYSDAVPVTATTAVPAFPYNTEQQAAASYFLPLSSTAADVTGVPYPVGASSYYYPGASSFRSDSDQAPPPAVGAQAANIYNGAPTTGSHNLHRELSVAGNQMPPVVFATPHPGGHQLADIYAFQAPSTVPAAVTFATNNTSAAASTSTAFAYFDASNSDLPPDDFLGRSARSFSHQISSGVSGTIPPPGSSSYNLMGGVGTIPPPDSSYNLITGVSGGSGTASSPGSPYNMTGNAPMHNLLEEETGAGSVVTAEAGGEKTIPCRHYWNRGRCDAGEHCRFVHAMDELRLYMPASGRFKTKHCKHWDGRPGSCPYGSFCMFAHGQEDLLPRGRRGRRGRQP